MFDDESIDDMLTHFTTISTLSLGKPLIMIK